MPKLSEDDIIKAIEKGELHALSLDTNVFHRPDSTRLFYAKTRSDLLAFATAVRSERVDNVDDWTDTGF